VSRQARRNRREITALMRECGFVEYPYEFWHYSAGDAYEEILLGTGRPSRYGAVDFDAASGRTTPLQDADKPLNSPEEIRVQIRAALSRCPSSTTAGVFG
jgi:zinc D-Ala-D-Ala dipeptidase